MGTHSKHRWSKPGRWSVLAVLLAACVVVACHQAWTPPASPMGMALDAQFTVTQARHDQDLDAFERQARLDPLAALQQALGECDGSVSDYTCTFQRQERLDGKLGPVERIRVKCRHEPFSVFMEWLANPGRCERLLYVKGQWKNHSGGEEAWVDPHGALVDTILGRRGGIRYDIHQAVAEGLTRKSVDQFGFLNTLRLVISVCERAREQGDLTLRYVGRSELTGRPTYLFERILPYENEQSPYPERLLLVHLDRELRLPIGVFSYADEQRKTVLASYVISDISLNPTLPDEVFSKQANGF